MQPSHCSSFWGDGAIFGIAARRNGTWTHGSGRKAYSAAIAGRRGNRAAAASRQGEAVSLKKITIRRDGAPHDALRAVDLDIAEGECVAIVGTSGAGKSTLFNMIAGELPVQKGSVAALPARLLTQRTELFQDSLRDNLLLARPGAADAELMEAMQAAGLGAFVSSLSGGLDTALGEGGLGLSGGQARRLALARLFLTDAPLWLLDEPTEGLDRATAEDVLGRLKQRLGSRTLLIATHIRREARICDRIIVLNQGILVETGSKGSSRFDEILEAMR